MNANYTANTQSRRDAGAPVHRYVAIIAALVFIQSILPLFAGPGTNGVPARNIGLEGDVTLTLPRNDYRPRPLDDRTELILRIESVTGTNGQFAYDFHYIGFEAGAYNLADFLIRPDGSRPDEIGNHRLQVQALLPDDHNGQLNAYVPRLFPFIGGYRAFLAVLAAVWVGGIVVFVMRSRKKRTVEAVAVAEVGPSLAERLRPLVEAAAVGKLTTDGQAQLERLLTSYWREKLALPELRMAEALIRLKAHAEAGELLRALERWLHRPGGVSASEVTRLLEPYRLVAAGAPPSPAALDQGMG